MDDADPISQFFPDVDPSTVDLYAVLGLSGTSTPAPSADDIKKAYRRAALLHHPDKHAAAPEETRALAARTFMQVGFAYAVLGDAARRTRYDATGSTTEALDGGAGADGWDAYFEQMFEKVTKATLDEMKTAYQGSEEETEDIKAAYLASTGSLDEIMRHIPHSTFADESRFIVIVNALVSSGALAETPTWKTTSKDEKARRVREKAAGKEAREAEQLAKELGVWDEFYGSGTPGARRGRGKGQGAADNAKPRSKGASPAKGKGKGKQPAAAADDDDEDADVGALQALILRRKSQREEKLGGFFDSLAAKYAEPAPGAKKGKRRRRAADDEDDDDADAHAGGAADAPPKKRARTKGAAAAPEISDAEFEALQAKLFGDKAKPAAPAVEKEKKNAKGRKAK